MSLGGCVGLVSACSTVDASGDTMPGSTSDVTNSGNTGPGSASNPSGGSAPTEGGEPTGEGSLSSATGGLTSDGPESDTATQGPETGDDTSDTSEPGEPGDPFLRGMNFGFRNPNWGDPDMAWLAAQAGSTSARLSLPETHLNKWGYDIEVGDNMQYQALGMGHHIAFLIAPIPEHSTAPQGTPDWELAHYIPNKLDVV